jgi:hypothetical protein
MQPMYYIGLDVHKRTIRYCVKDGSGAMHAEGTLPATRWDLDRFATRSGATSDFAALMRKCGDEVRELLHDACPVASLGDALFGYVNVFTSYVNGGEAAFHLFRIQAGALPCDGDNPVC